jgi:hypothetical protein
VQGAVTEHVLSAMRVLRGHLGAELRTGLCGCAADLGQGVTTSTDSPTQRSRATVDVTETGAPSVRSVAGGDGDGGRTL